MATNFSNEIIASIMTILAIHYRQEIFIEPDEMIFIRKEITESGNIYYPIVNDNEYSNPSPILALNENKLFSIIDVKKAEKSVEKRILSGLKASEMRITYRDESVNNQDKSVNIPEQKHSTERLKGIKISNNKREELLRFNGLEPFHEKYTDIRFDLILKLEQLTYELIENGSKKVIDWSKTNYKNANKLAKTDPAELIKLVETTENKRRQQIAALNTNRIKGSRKKISDKVKIFLVVTSIGIALLLGIITSIRHKNNTLPGKNNTTTKTNTTIFSDTQIDSLINVFEFEHNTKIYVWRRNQIKEAFQDTELTEQEAIKIIDSIAYYNFKSNNQPGNTTHTQQNKQPTSYSTDDNGIGYNPNIQTTYNP